MFSTPNPACLPRAGDLSLSSDINLADNQSQLFLFYNYIIGCNFESQTSSVLVLPDDERAELDKREYREDDVVVAPIRMRILKG